MNLIDISTADGRRVFSTDSETLHKVDWTAYARLTVDHPRRGLLELDRSQPPRRTHHHGYRGRAQAG